ncbi:MAG: hypothetical protein ACXW03_04245 [Methylobacter sp.]
MNYHTLWIVNDNDFLPAFARRNKFFVFGFSDADLAQLGVKEGLVTQKFDRRANLRYKPNEIQGLVPLDFYLFMY